MMSDAEISLAEWSTEPVLPSSGLQPDSTRLPLAVCWIVWLGLSLGGWAVILSPFLR